ncbi:MAG: haloacid dehalogenase type II [Alphaproteobacteria bacterium]|nr:haloacid dehalogenase type II [Alphaproteobacteria bacterium]
MRLADFKVLTFDCYGTLIDWESGLWTALGPLVNAGRLTLEREVALEAFSKVEVALERDAPSLRYSALLATAHAKLAQEWGVPIFAELNDRFGGSVPDWPAFPDSAEALRYLKRHFKLVVLSNVHRDGFAASAKKLGVTFDAAYVAEDIGSYKPSQRNFQHMLDRLEADFGVRKAEILHTAQSLHHDHVPAERAGLARAWINRRHGREGGGATAPVADPPAVHFEFKSMAEMAEAHRQSVAG